MYSQRTDKSNFLFIAYMCSIGWHELTNSYVHEPGDKPAHRWPIDAAFQSEYVDIVQQIFTQDKKKSCFRSIAGNLVDTSERSEKPGMLKAEFGRICDLLHAFSETQNSTIHDAVLEMCEDAYNGLEICVSALHRVDWYDNSQVSAKALAVENTAKWRSCEQFGPMIFNKLPVDFYQRHKSGDRTLYSMSTFQRCMQDLISHFSRCKAIFYDGRRCRCYQEIPTEYNNQPGSKCQGLIIKSLQTSSFAGETFNTGFPVSFGDMVVGDVLGKANVQISLSSYRNKWRKMVQWAYHFFNYNVRPRDVAHMNNTLYEILESKKDLCSQKCREKKSCIAFQIRLLKDWTTLDLTESELGSIPGECVFYENWGLKYVQGKFNLMSKLGSWVDSVPVALLYEDDWWTHELVAKYFGLKLLKNVS